MDKLFFKLFFVTLFLIGSFIYIFPWKIYNIDMPFSGQDYKLGLDLQGGVELDYKVELEEVKKEKNYDTSKEDSILEGLKSIIDKRVESLKINDSVITTANYGGEKHIIVQIPLKGTSKQENNLNIIRAKQAIGKVMKIEFKELRTEITKEDLMERQEIANKLLKESLSSKYDFSLTQSKYKDSYENISIGTMSGTIKELSKYFIINSSSNIGTGIYNQVLSGTGFETYSVKGGKNINDIGYWVVNINNLSGENIDFDYAFISSQPSEWKSAMDSKGRILNDKYFVTSSVQQNEAFQPMIELIFNNDGAEIFGELTTRLKGKQIAIFVGGDKLTNPTVNDAILTGKAVITGNYTWEEARKLSSDINTGVVPAPIYLTSERTIDSKLGSNSLTKLVYAGIYGFLIIFIFLTIVYRMSGFLSGIALFNYTCIVLLIVKAFGIVLTLAGIAGLILSIGIAIDANILIFARIMDELNAGVKLDKAIKNGFDKSWSAIWDSNLTGLIISIVLFIFGVNMIKGFGLMLGIGIIVSLFSAMFISRLFILILSRKKGLSMKFFLGMK